MPSVHFHQHDDASSVFNLDSNSLWTSSLLWIHCAPWMTLIFLKHGSLCFGFFSLPFPCSKTFMTLGGLLGFYHIREGGLRPYAWAMVKFRSRCPSGGAVGLCPWRDASCQRHSTGAEAAADPSRAETEARALGLRGRVSSERGRKA